MKRKIYKLSAGLKQGAFALALTVFSCAAYSQAIYTFSYTGGQQTLALPAGSYSIECWGGDGGAGGNATPPLTGTAGIGGYSKGVYTTASTTTLYISVGGKGQSTNTSGASVATAPGGWNGGGSGWNGSSNTNYKGGGGGASHVATVTGTLGALASNTSAVIIVAGGGGGAGGSTGTPLTWVGSGGNGGGTTGQDGVLAGSQVNHNGKGGTQNAGGAGGVNGTNIGVSGSFGAGGNGGGTSNTFPAGGGGAGWYGGGGGSTQGGGGGGGSSYIGGVTSGTTIMSGQAGFTINPDVSGNGRVYITELCSITLSNSATGNNNAAICSGTSLTLTTDAVNNYSWSTGSTASFVIITPTITTVYSLSALSAANCTAVKNITITVNNGTPTLAVTASTTQLCLGQTATLTASGALTYTWTNGVTNGATFSPTLTNTYTVNGQNACGTATAAATIVVAPLQVNTSSSSPTICSGSALTLSVSAAANAYTWQPGNVNTGSNPFLSVSPLVSTIYTVTASDGTCSGVATINLVTNPVPTLMVSASATNNVCEGDPVIMSVTGGNNYTWTPGNLSGTSVTVNPTAPIAYMVTGDNSLGCTTTTSQIIITVPIPTVVVTADVNFICANSPVNLTVTGASTYLWDSGATGTTITFNPGTSTIISVTGTSNTCSHTETLAIDVFNPPLSITGPTDVCNGGTASLTASGANSYTWSTGSNFQGTTVTPTITSTYTVSTFTFSGNLNCPASASFQVIVKPSPVVTAVPSRSAICKNESVDIVAGGANTYSWNNGANTASITVTSTLITTLFFTVTGTNAQGCSTESVVQVKVNSCNAIAENNNEAQQLVIYPNPSNGNFTIRHSSAIELIMMNELGQVVKTLNLNADSDFEATVSNLAKGVYFVVGQKNNTVYHQKLIVH